MSYLIACKLKEIFILPALPKINCFTDNRSLKETVYTSNSIDDKRLLVDISRIREMVQLEDISVDWVKKENQLADALTKRGASTKNLLQALCNE